MQAQGQPAGLLTVSDTHTTCSMTRTSSLPSRVPAQGAQPSLPPRNPKHLPAQKDLGVHVADMHRLFHGMSSLRMRDTDHCRSSGGSSSSSSQVPPFSPGTSSRALQPEQAQAEHIRDSARTWERKAQQGVSGGRGWGRCCSYERHSVPPAGSG